MSPSSGLATVCSSSSRVHETSPSPSLSTSLSTGGDGISTCSTPTIPYRDPKLWMQACDAAIRDLSKETGTDAKLKLSRAIAASFPAEWRAPNVFSPAKSDLLTQLYGDQWFETVWTVPGGLWLSPTDFRKWTKSTESRTRVQTNARWWCSGRCSSSLSALDWHRILQACVDFDLPRTWDFVYRRALASHSWNPNQLALFLFTY